MSENENDDDIPTLHDVLRPGDLPPQSERRREGPGASVDAPLSEAEIEAIAARVVERHTERMQEAVARAIRQALERQSPPSDVDE